MKIKKFNESFDSIDISGDRVNEIIEDLREIVANLEDKNKKVKSYTNELSNYKSSSKKGNDQIDDSISALEIVVKNNNESIDKIDTIINNLLNYNENGRDFLYTSD
jgi:ABC-type transporter Mla subunit MlaD